jgi:hypothetical protein
MTVGEFVDISKNTLPGAALSMSPLGPSATASTSVGVGTDVKTTSHAAITADAVAAHSAPAARCVVARSSRISLTTRS